MPWPGQRSCGVGEMTIDRLDIVFYTLAFVVPGFVLHSTFGMFVPRKDERADLTLLRFLTWTSLNYAIWSWLIYLLFHVEFFTAHPIRSSIAWVTAGSTWGSAGSWTVTRSPST